MSNEYIVARRSAMIIRVVEPAQFTGRIVAERRSVSIAGDIAFAKDEMPACSSALCVGLCALLVAGFVYCITWGLEALSNAWLF
jgi:hypothetical protein